MLSSQDSWKPLRLKDMEAEQIEVMISVIDQLPELPVHVHEIMKIVSDIDSNAMEIAKLASTDPILVSKILKVANSSYYGFSKKIEDLQQAIVLLGLGEIITLTLQNSLPKRLGNIVTYKGYDTKDLWNHSYQVSVCAEAFADKKDNKLTGIFQTIGLLHDIGKFILYNIALALTSKKFQQKYLTIGLDTNVNVLKKEERLFRVNHTIVGGMIARRWGFPERIAMVIEYHHSPSFYDIDELPIGYYEDIMVVNLADIVVHYLENSTGIPPQPPIDFFKILGYNPPIEKLITESLRIKIEKAKSFLKYID